MKSKAFSLTELLVVLAMAAVLMLAVLPCSNGVVAMARQTLCQNNLRNIWTAVKVERTDSGQAMSMPLPTVTDWPSAAADAVPDMAMFKCPSDPREEAPVNKIPDLYYQTNTAEPPFDLLAFDPETLTIYGCHCTATRRGCDADGPYTEFVIEDDPAVDAQFKDAPKGETDPKFYNQGHNNEGGVWRVYDNIAGKRQLRLVYYTENKSNKLHHKGQVIWDSLLAHLYPNDHLSLPPAVMTSYGLNSLVDRKSVVRTQTAVLLDYVEAIVEPNVPTVNVKLTSPDSARHRNGHNVLSGDGAVRWAPTTSMNPLLYMDRWEP